MLDLTERFQFDGQGSIKHRSRLGPRPLALHIAQAHAAWRTQDPKRLADFFRGIKTYRNHPYQRKTISRSPVWQCGATELKDYGPDEGWPLLVVPSLINRAYVLDLTPETSLLSFLHDRGIRPFLLDWGRPKTHDRLLTLDDYILQRLGTAFDWVIKETGQRPLMLGYCMGGTLATALACRRASDCAGLALLASPWDFRQGQPAIELLINGGQALANYSGMIGSTSVDLLQSLFAMIDPMAVPKKFVGFAKLDPASEAASRFVAVEDWLNDGVPLGADLAAKCLISWYGKNAPALGNWKVGDQTVRPELLDIPAFLAIPSHDRIVPARSALALAKALPSATIIRPESGHIGMVAGRKARAQLWTPLLAWLQEIAAMQKK